MVDKMIYLRDDNIPEGANGLRGIGGTRITNIFIEIIIANHRCEPVKNREYHTNNNDKEPKAFFL
jgi:hypothetical protein